MPLEPATKAIVDRAADAGAIDFARITPARLRRIFMTGLAALDVPGPEVGLDEAEDRTVPGPAGELRVRVYRPPTTGAVPVVVFFHGGGFVIGNVDTHDGTCRTLCRLAQAVVVSVDYRLAPEHRFPAALDDCEAATRWVAAHAAELGADPGRVGVAGDSAGGNLAAAVTLRARAARQPPLAAQALVYPTVDFTTDRPSVVANGQGYLLSAEAVHWFVGQYLGDHDRADPMASPLLADLAGLPPAVVATAEFDPLHDEGGDYASALAAAGVPVTHLDFPGLVHGFLGLGALSPGSARATEELWATFAALLRD